MNKEHGISTLVALLISCFSFSQVQDPVFVDDHGVMRWCDSKREVTLFGVNYTIPFAHAFRAHDYIDVDHKMAIDADVYHFARLGLDAYRCHIWDSEICDSLGNIIPTRQLDALDYLLFNLHKRGIKSILTPLKFGSNGYPEPDTLTPGFSDIYGKDDCLNNPESWPCQERYLIGFLEHINPYKGTSYKDDPDIIAIEINNEPRHETAELTREYIETMITAIRSTGCTKPVFYNMSHNFHVTGEFLDADIQGGSFQWYPSGLVANHEQQGNYLPNVDVYPIPFSNHKKFRNKAKMIYEFDPADIGKSYIYPAMARSLRESGFQFAAQFAYDPVFIAYANTEYQTHYMNLAYAPQKALSLMIASEVFHRLPLYQNYGKYPENLKFDVFRVSYKDDLAEMVTIKMFLHTSKTSTNPPIPDSLEHIAGYGSSPIVDYEGTGAYFLDRLEEGIWRLEVMPDAVWVRDPFEKASLKKMVSIIKWREWPMSINLPDLGVDFDIRGINAGNTLVTSSRGRDFKISPGTYLLERKGISSCYTGDEKWKNILLSEFSAPGPSGKDLYLLHNSVREYSIGQVVKLQAKIVSEKKPEKVEINFTVPGQESSNIEMKHTGGYDFETTLPDILQNTGFLEYHISVLKDGQWISWPSMWQGHPGDWDFFAGKTYKVRVVRNEAPIQLFSPSEDIGRVTWQTWHGNHALMPGKFPGRDIMIFSELRSEVPDYSFKLYFKDKITGRISDLAGMKRIVILGKSDTSIPCPVHFALVMDDGTTCGGKLQLGTETKEYSITLDQLKAVPMNLTPEGFPGFLPRSFQHTGSITFDINRIEMMQLTIGAGIPESSSGRKFAVSIEGIWLE
jgi:hypothetical protein